MGPHPPVAYVLDRKTRVSNATNLLSEQAWGQERTKSWYRDSHIHGGAYLQGWVVFRGVRGQKGTLGAERRPREAEQSGESRRSRGRISGDRVIQQQLLFWQMEGRRATGMSEVYTVHSMAWPKLDLQKARRVKRDKKTSQEKHNRQQKNLIFSTYLLWDYRIGLFYPH